MSPVPPPLSQPNINYESPETLDLVEKKLMVSRSQTMWEKDRVRVRTHIQRSLTLKPWTSRPTTRLHGIPRTSAIVHEILDTCYWKQFKKLGDIGKWCDDDWVHITQNTQRLPVSDGLPCLVANSICYKFGADQIIGWPSDRIPSALVSDGEARDLAGNSFSIPIAGLIQAACIANPHGPWWR